MPIGGYPNVYWREGPFGIHSEDKLLGGEPNVKRDMRILGDCATRSKSESSLTAAFPSFSQLP
jgi:hypothetical protein